MMTARMIPRITPIVMRSRPVAGRIANAPLSTVVELPSASITVRTIFTFEESMLGATHGYVWTPTSLPEICPFPALDV